MDAWVEKSVWLDLASFVYGKSSPRDLRNLLSCWDELQAVDVRAWMLEAALQHKDIEACILLVKRGAPLREAAKACVALFEGKSFPPCTSEAARRGHQMEIPRTGPHGQFQLVQLIGAAYWAGRGSELCQRSELCQELIAAAEICRERIMLLRQRRGDINAKAQYASRTTEEFVKDCAGEVGTALLEVLIDRGDPEDRAMIELLVHGGAPMPCNVCWHDGFNMRKLALRKGFKMLYRASCGAGRDSELLKILECSRLELCDSGLRDEGGLAQCFLRGIHDRADFSTNSDFHELHYEDQLEEMRGELRWLRESGLIGPLALSLVTAIRAQLAGLSLRAVRPARDEVDYLVEAQELLQEYADADRRFAQHLANILSPKMSAHPANLIAAFSVAEPAHPQERRGGGEGTPAYTWKQFLDFYGNLTDASWYWTRAKPASHEEHLQPIDVDEEDVLSTGDNASGIDGSNSVIDLVLHVDPPARVEPEIAAEVVAVMEACAVERHVGSAVLDEQETQACTDRLVFLQFNRCSKTLRDALAHGLALKHCREELEEAGCDFSLPCRNMVFVHPAQYHDARRAPLPWTGAKLRCFYIIVSESLEYLVEETLSGIGKGVWGKTREMLPLRTSTEAATVDDDELPNESESDGDSTPRILERTFLTFGKKPLRNSASVGQSTTEVHGGGRNPRRVLPIEM